MAETVRYALFGNPVAQSLSPAMHAAAYAALGIPADYAAYRVDEASEVVRVIRESGISGASVTIPFKESVMPLLDEIDPAAAAIGAINTIVSRNGRLSGFNTDAPGFLRDLGEWMAIPARVFVVLGAGGAARAALYALREAGGKPICVNRTAARAEELARSLGCRWEPAEALAGLRADCLINTTPLGMYPEIGRTPVEARLLAGFPRVMDMIYNPPQTRLLREAEAAGCAVRSGIGMFVHQGAEQIRLWTGQEPPVAEMRRIVLERLKHHD
ncbi:MAG: shikimate dehydrogenase [Syntrophales bacterium]